MLSVASLFQGTATGSARSARSARRSLAAREEERRRLDAAMQELPEVPRLALALRYFESARPRQIALVLGIPEDRVEAVLAEAVREVTRILQRPEEAMPAAAGSRGRAHRAPARKAARS
jgi:DNA-directed RNA polymerase specialized sigma24 family protein